MTFFDVKQYKNYKIFTINFEIIDEKNFKNLIKNFNCSKILINMKNVKTINSPLFVELLRKDVFKMYNVSNEVLIYLSLILKSGKLNTYLYVEDFLQNKNELIRRKFYVA